GAAAARTVRNLEPVPVSDPLGDEIALLCAHINAATYRLLRLLGRYDEEGRWGGGFRSCAHWLSWRTGISIGPAREKVRVARCLPSLPLISEALASGELSYSKVRALTRVATPDNEAELLSFAHHGTTSHVEHLVRLWRRVDRNADSQATRTARRGLSVWLTDDGSYAVRGRLTPEVGALLQKALEAAEDKLFRAEHEAGVEDRTSPKQRLADALGLWLEERVQPHVQLVVHAFAEDGDAREVDGRADATCSCDAQEEKQKEETPAALVTEDGSRVPAETSSRLACDAEVVPIARGADGSVLDVGRRRRTVGWRLRKALETRDGGCRFPGCDSRMRTHAHHITPSAAGGETAMNNLVLLCPFHHRAVHEGGWRVKMDEWGVPRFFNPLGAPMPEVPGVGELVSEGEGPGGMAPAELPAGDHGLARWHAGREIRVWPGTTVWQGERIDWSWAVSYFWSGGKEH
ncbi:MAG: DUF222 domain-containing protein, partial [Gemmatimonadetes bacterium]|nr:DUF222 domain-containing protein [Gemmatimonadota bacterium]